MKVKVVKDDTTLTQYRNGHFIGHAPDGRARFERHTIIPDGSAPVVLPNGVVINRGVCLCGEKVYQAITS